MTAFVRLTSRRALPEIATIFPVSSNIFSNATPTQLSNLSSTQRRRPRDVTRLRSWRFYATNAQSAGKVDASALKKDRNSVSKEDRPARKLKLPFVLDEVFSEEVVDGGKVEEDVDVEPVDIGVGDLRKEISLAPTLEELLSTVKGRRFHNWHYVQLIWKVTKLMQEADSEHSKLLAHSEHYIFRLLNLDSKVADLRSPIVFAVTRNLFTQAESVPQLLERDNFVKILESFENECCWRFREADLKEVVNVLLCYGSGPGPRTSQNCLRDAAIGQLELRWTELDVKMIIDILHKLKDPPENIQHCIETRILDSVESMSVKQLVNILGIFSQSAKTNIQLVKTLSFHLSKNEEVFSFDQVSKVAFHLANASFLSYPLLEKLCGDLKNSDFGGVPSLVDDFHLSSLIVSFGKLRWRDPGVLEELCNILSAKCNAQDCNSKSLNPALQSVIKTLSHLSFSPVVLPQLKPHLLNSIDVEHNSPNYLTQIENVSSLSLLGLVTPDRVEALISAFNPEKASRMPKASLTKLLQINSNAIVNSLSRHSLSVPPLPQLAPPPASPPTSSTDAENEPKDKAAELGRMGRFRSEFRQYFPAAQIKANSSSKYLVDGPWLHPSGHIVDIVVVVDRKGNILPVPDALVAALTLTQSTTLTAEAMSISAHLQPDTHAIAILLFDVFDFTVYSEMPVGEKIYASRDLRAFGFKPCIVSLRQFYVETKSRRTEFINKAVSGALEPV